MEVSSESHGKGLQCEIDVPSSSAVMSSPEELSPVTDQANRTMDLNNKIFGNGLIIDKILNFAIRDEQGAVSPKNALSCRLVDMSWLESVTRCLKISSAPLFRFRLESSDFYKFVKAYTSTSRVLETVPPIRILVDFKSLRLNDIGKETREHLGRCLCSLKSDLLSLDLQYDYGYVNREIDAVPDVGITSVLQSFLSSCMQLDSKFSFADNVSFLQDCVALTRITKVRIPWSLRSIRNQLQHLTMNVNLVHVTDLTLTVVEPFTLPVAHSLCQAFSKVSKLVLSTDAFPDLHIGLHFIFQNMTRVEKLSLTVVEHYEFPGSPTFWNTLLIGLQPTNCESGSLPPGYIPAVANLSELRELELCLHNSRLRSDLSTFPNTVIDLAFMKMPKLLNLQLTGYIDVSQAAVCKWEEAGRVILCKLTRPSSVFRN